MEIVAQYGGVPDQDMSMRHEPMVSERHEQRRRFHDRAKWPHDKGVSAESHEPPCSAMALAISASASGIIPCLR